MATLKSKIDKALGKPPALPGDSQSLTVPGVKATNSLRWTAQSSTERESVMPDIETLSHTKWDCKYHVVFIPKYRRKALYHELRRHLGEVFRALAEQKECRIEEGHLMGDHVHMLLSIPPKYSVAQVVGFIKGKAAIHIARTFMGRSEEHTSELQSLAYLVCRLLLEKKKKKNYNALQLEKTNIALYITDLP